MENAIISIMCTNNQLCSISPSPVHIQGSVLKSDTNVSVNMTPSFVLGSIVSRGTDRQIESILHTKKMSNQMLPDASFHVFTQRKKKNAVSVSPLSSAHVQPSSLCPGFLLFFSPTLHRCIRSFSAPHSLLFFF